MLFRSTVLACSDMTGCYITQNGGKSWREFNLRIRVDVFAFDPSEPEIMYAGSTGVFRSVDGGKKWSLILPRPENIAEEIMVGDEADNAYISEDGSWPSFLGENLQEDKTQRAYRAGNRPSAKIQALQVDPEQSNHIYAGFNPNAQLVNTAEDKVLNRLFIYHSPDGGSSWKELEGVTGGRIDNIFIDPASPRENRYVYIFTDIGLYAGHVNSPELTRMNYPVGVEYILDSGWGVNPETNKPVFYITSHSAWQGGIFNTGVWKSTDCGHTWKQLEKGLYEGISGPETGKLPVYKLIAPCERDAQIGRASCRERV